MLCDFELPMFVPCYDSLAELSGNFNGSGPVQTGDTSGFPGSYIPKVWAMESLRILKENMGVTNLVHRDFQNEVASYGDLVHTRRPGTMPVRRRSDSTTVASINPQATDVQVPLNQWFNQTFTIPEGAMSKSFLELVQIYLEPAILSIARGVDRSVLGRFATAYLCNQRAGHLGGLSSETAYTACVTADQVLNTNLAPQEGRNLLLAPSAKASMLGCDKFVEAQKRGDGGETLRTAELGTILNFGTYMFQNVPCILGNADIEVGTVTAAHAAGSTDSQALSLTDCVAGEFVTVAGNDQPTWAYAVDGTSNAVTLNEANVYATAAGATATRYKACAVAASIDARLANSSPYPASWSEEVYLGSYGAAPQQGQLLALGTGANRAMYVIIEATAVGNTTCVILDRPLDYQVAVDTTGKRLPRSDGLVQHRHAPERSGPRHPSSGYDPRGRDRVRRAGGLRHGHPHRHAAQDQRGPRGRRRSAGRRCRAGQPSGRASARLRSDTRWSHPGRLAGVAARIAGGAIWGCQTCG